jgi:hypothetical protein
MTKLALLLVGLLPLVSVTAQEPDGQGHKGVVYGVVVDLDGNPAKEVSLIAMPLGVGLGAILPGTRTDRSGHYRSERLSWWGRYTVHGNDPDAGYSFFSTGMAVPPGQPPEVTISPEQPEAELNLRLPPRAGFLHVHLTNRKTGAILSDLEVRVTLTDDINTPVFEGSSNSRSALLIPPDKDLLLHVTSQGFHEWDESAGRGKRIRFASGSHTNLDVELKPVQ